MGRDSTDQNGKWRKMGDMSLLLQKGTENSPHHKNSSDAVQMQGKQLQERIYGECMNRKRIKCFLTGGCKFKSSDTESKCNDKEKTCTITETCYKCGKKYTAVFTYKQLGIPVR